MEQRLAWFDQLVAEAGTGVRELDDGVTLRFSAKPGVHRQLNEMVERERKCCASIQWEVTEDPSSSVLFLTCRGSSAARDFMNVSVLKGKNLSRF